MTHPSIEQLSQCWDSLAGLLDPLTEDQWNTPSCCPDWTVKGVVAHLAAIEHILTGWAPSVDNPPPFDQIAPFMAAAEQMTGAEMYERFIDITDERRTDFAGMDEADFEKPSFTPVGAADYGRFMNVRVFDFWVHEQDIRHPLEIPGHESGAAAETAMDEVERSLGYIFGKKVGLEDGQSVTVNTQGGVTRTMHVVVDGRAKQVESLDDPSLVIDTDSTTFVMLACGRIDPQEEIDAGRIRWTGDDALGRQAANNLRFTM